MRETAHEPLREEAARLALDEPQTREGLLTCCDHDEGQRSMETQGGLQSPQVAETVPTQAHWAVPETASFDIYPVAGWNERSASAGARSAKPSLPFEVNIYEERL